jgi:O-antigen/teichoic acid export membrane protein
LSILIFFKHDFYFLKNIDNNWLVIPIGTFIVGMIQSSSGWLNRSANYNALSLGRIINAISITVCTIFFGYFFRSVMGLIMGFMIGNFFQLLYFFYIQTKIFTTLQHSIAFNFSRYKIILIKYISFPTINLPQAIISGLQINILIYLVDYFFLKSDVGNLSLAIRLMLLPVSLIGASMAQLIYKEAVVKYHDNEPLKLFAKQYIKKTTIIYIPFLMVFFAAPFCFPIIFGQKWNDSGLYVPILSLWFFSDFIRSPLSQLVLVVNKQKKWFVLSTISLIITIISFIISALLIHKILIVLAIVSALATINNMLLIYWVYKSLK